MIVTSLVLAAAVAAAPPPPKTDAELGAAIAALVEGAAARDEFSGAVLVRRGGRALYRGAAGLASRQPPTPNTPETKFNIGSVDKAFTRLAVEQLAAEGKLSLSDPIGKHVAGLPDATARVTLQQLVEHRGGTGDIFGPRYDAADRTALRELRDWLPLFADQPLAFEPGAGQRYSNAGYILLGLAIEKVTGRAYRDHVRERIFAPAGMADTGAHPIDAATANRATGYTPGDDGLSDNRATLPWRGTSAGGGYSTVDDLGRFADALREGRLGPKGGSLGIAGGAPGVNAMLDMIGDDTVVVLANLDPPAATRLAESIRKVLGHEDGEGSGRRVRRIGAGESPAARPAGPMVLPSGPMAAPAKSIVPAAGVTLPMRRHGHLPAVEVLVDGKGPYLFAIDTGAAGTARIDAALAEKLGLARVGEARGGDPSGRNAQVMPIVAIATIDVGGARFEGVHAAARDMKAMPPMPDGSVADGILGFGLFAECLLTLDYPGAAVRIARGEVAAGPDALAFTLDRGVPTIPITVAGRAFEAYVDSGFRGGLSLPESESARLPLAGPLAVVGRARTVSNTFEVKGATLDGDASMGPIALARPAVEFQPVFTHATVGPKVLGALVVTSDQRNGPLRMARAAPSPAAVAPREPSA
jgi:CubicO group peptidase (beta-lactamase class C family)